LTVSNAVPAGSRQVTVAFNFISERTVLINNNQEGIKRINKKLIKKENKNLKYNPLNITIFVTNLK
jgi:hypothetical protein